ncbi:hypothetical protein [Microcella sp.]|uniref:hypothetical protein n=1 Tax=Microcella sp. TaxID=1913979 RepID=UPI00256565B1|nr:hypothetical protein [Microcella sp.]MBX9471213.1 hypothetical protein [Microcella sp.]
MRRPIAIVTAVALVMAALSGCSPLVEPEPAPVVIDAPSSLDEVSATAEVYRTRSDPARGGLQLSVSNTGTTPLTVLHAVLDSPALAEAIERDRTTVIPPGATRDLALLLPPPRCDGGPTLPEAVLTVALASGATAELRLPTTDRIGQWVDWHERACFAEAAAAQVDLEVRRAPALDDPAAGTIGAELVATARVSGVRLVAIADTVLFGLRTGPTDSGRVSTLALDRVLTAAETMTVPIWLAAARCDPHAVAEDKQGTLFTVHLDLDGETGTTTVIAADETRAALYDAIAETCGF